MLKNFSLILFFVSINMFFELSCLSPKNNLKVDKSLTLTQILYKNATAEDYYSYATLKKCNENNCNWMHGICTSNTTCHCRKQYANFLPNGSNSSDYSACTYTRKQQQIAFLLEFFIPFGASHFYLGNYDTAILKLSSLIILPILLICLGCVVVRPNNTAMITKKMNVDSLIILYSIAVLIWVFYDVLNISLDRYKDANGVKMLSW